MGGLVLVGALTGSALLWSRLDTPAVWAALAVTSGYGAIGLLDDWIKVMKRDPAGLAGRYKILGQVLVGGGVLGACYASGVVDADVSLPFFKDAALRLGSPWPGAPSILGWSYVLFGMFVLTAMSNGVNLTDGLDGLAIGPTMTSAATLGVMTYVAGNVRFANYLGIPYVEGAGELLVLALAIVGAGLGFLWYNAYPAQVFMGDVGSLALGGALGMLGLLCGQELLLPVVGGIFVLESVSVILQVVWFKSTGQRLFRMAPIHHHYEKLGWSEPKIIVRFWVISVVLALVALSTLKLR
jgi:phospho-N-acetylmuramoyl-pentapeptide-transferase